MVVGLGIIVAGAWWNAARIGFAVPPLAIDLDLYLDATRRFLGGGPFYHPYQSAPYGLWTDPLPILYPPPILVLLVPFTLLPAVLWWAPILIVVGVAWYHRTRWEALAVMALLAAWPTSSVALIWTGNPAMWACAALALATIRPAFGPLVLLKPSLGLFALWGFRHSEWWKALALVVVVALAFLPMWPDYLTAVRNSGQPLTYSIWNVPLMLIPVVAWLGRSGHHVKEVGAEGDAGAAAE